MRRKLWTTTDASFGEIFHTGACDQGLALLSELHRPCNDAPNPLRRLDKVRVGKVGVARRGPVPLVPEQLADQGQILAGHDGLAGGGVPQIMQPQPAEFRIGANCPPAGCKAEGAPAFGVARKKERIGVARTGSAATCGRAAVPSGTLRGPVFESSGFSASAPMFRQRKFTAL